MGRRRCRSQIDSLLAGLVLLLVAGDPAYSVAGDPFSDLRITRLSSGSPAAIFDLKSLDGGTLHSKELTGKVVVLNFWATWCGPCREEMPALAKLQERFDPTQVRVVTVTTDLHPQGIKQFLDHLGIRLTVLFDEDQEVSRSFMVRGLPTTVVITPDGRAVGRAVGPRAWDGEESVALVRHVLEGMR